MTRRHHSGLVDDLDVTEVYHVQERRHGGYGASLPASRDDRVVKPDYGDHPPPPHGRPLRDDVVHRRESPSHFPRTDRA